MRVQTNNHPWSFDALFSKALLFADEMEGHTANDWQFGLWSCLSLELLARAALARVSPTLLAEGKDWRNVHYALGYGPTAKRFVPTSAGTADVFQMLQELVPDFPKELVDFCIKHLARRNAELHTGEAVFASLGTSEWLPKYYASCKVMLLSMGKGLGDFFDDPAHAEEMIAALEDQAAKAVDKDIKAHAQVWQNKSEEERKTLLEQATLKATRDVGHRAVCPSCESPALVFGSARGTVTTRLDEDEIVQKQSMVPASFECTACGLRIAGLSKLAACGLGDSFTATSTYSAAEFFKLHTDDELEQARQEGFGPEEDFNEY